MTDPTTSHDESQNTRGSADEIFGAFLKVLLQTLWLRSVWH